MDSQAKVVLRAFALLVCVLFTVPVTSDPDPVSDYEPGVTEFVYRDIFRNGVITNGPGGTRAALSTTIFPALIGQGITYVHFKLKPCGENLPHTHPRATELVTLISGGPIQAGFVDTAGVPHIYILYPGDLIIFPRALMHFEVNVGKDEAFFVSALNSQNPGTMISGGGVLQLPDRAAAGAFHQDLFAWRQIKKRAYPYDLQLQHNDFSTGCIPGHDINAFF